MPHTSHEHVSFFRKKPIVIEAMQWDPDNPQPMLDWLTVLGAGYLHVVIGGLRELRITTLEGDMQVRPGCYVIRGVRGEVYPCEKSIFEETYETAGDGDDAA